MTSNSVDKQGLNRRAACGGPRPKAFGIVIYSEDRPERGSFVDGGNL